MKVYESDAAAEKEILSWWKKNKYYLAIVVLGVIMIASTFMNIKQYRENLNIKIATIFYHIVPGLMLENNEAAIKQVSDLKLYHPNSVYTTLSSLITAKYYVNKKEYEKAIEQYNWVINHNKNDFRSMAELKIARIYIQLDKADEAIKILQKEHIFKAEKTMILGDAYTKLKDLTKAKASYAEGMKVCDKKYETSLCDVLAMKYNNINYVAAAKS